MSKKNNDEMIELVIQIPKKLYDQKVAIWNSMFGSTMLNDTDLAILSGQILPKGHGDLIEREKLLEQADEIVTYCRQQEVDYDVIFVNDVENAPTIIEADKEAENDCKKMQRM